jgi:hypothetical protein
MNKKTKTLLMVGGGLVVAYLIYKASKKKVSFANAVGRSRLSSDTQTPYEGQQLSPVSNYLTLTNFWSNHINSTSNPNRGHMIKAGEKVKGYDTWIREDVPDTISSQNANNPYWSVPLVRGVKVIEHSSAPNGQTTAPHVNIIVKENKLRKV